MRKLVVLTFVSLDGVMQAPGGKGEDPSGGFQHEGWIVPYFDAAGSAEMTRQMQVPFDLLLGRKTFDIFASYWPHQTTPTAHGLNAATKYVVSTQPVSAQWKTTVPITGDVPAEIQKLKDQDGPDLQVHGSSDLLQTLLANDLVDELWLKTFPVTLGKGKRLFGQGTKPAAYQLTYSLVTPSGVIIANYKRDGDVKVGSFN